MNDVFRNRLRKYESFGYTIRTCKLQNNENFVDLRNNDMDSRGY